MVDYLGLRVDNSLKWKDHIQKIKSKITPIIFALKKARNCLTMKCCWNIYNSFIVPHLNYMNCIWGSASVSQLNGLTVLQNKVIKTIKKLPVLFSTIDLYSESLLSLNDLYEYNILLLIYKMKNGHIKCNIPLLQAQHIHSFDTRNRDHYIVERARTRLAVRNVFFSGIIKFNALPSELKSEENIITFKKKLRRFVYTAIA